MFNFHLFLSLFLEKIICIFSRLVVDFSSCNITASMKRYFFYFSNFFLSALTIFLPNTNSHTLASGPHSEIWSKHDEAPAGAAFICSFPWSGGGGGCVALGSRWKRKRYKRRGDVRGEVMDCHRW